MAPLRVALLHNIVSPHVVPLFERLARQPGVDLKVYFLAETDRNRRWRPTVEGRFAHEVLPSWALRVGHRYLYTYFVNPTVVPTLVRDGFDVVLSAGWDSYAAQASWLLCRRRGAPFVLWSGSTAWERSWRRTLTLPLVRAMVRSASGWIAYGSRARAYLAQLGAPAERVAIAYNTVDVAWWRARSDELRPRRAVIRDDLRLGPGPVVLYVGQMAAVKGLGDLLDAHARLLARRPDAQLVLVGYGPLEDTLRGEVVRRRLPGVRFAGHVPLQELPPWYVAADVFVLPSREDVWGLVLNEAAACALPLVTTSAVGGSADLVHPGVNGVVVQPGAPEQLAGAVDHVLEHRSPMGQESRRIVADMTYAQNVAAIAGVLRSLRAGPPA